MPSTEFEGWSRVQTHGGAGEAPPRRLSLGRLHRYRPRWQAPPMGRPQPDPGDSTFKIYRELFSYLGTPRSVPESLRSPLEERGCMRVVASRGRGFRFNCDGYPLPLKASATEELAFVTADAATQCLQVWLQQKLVGKRSLTITAA